MKSYRCEKRNDQKSSFCHASLSMITILRRLEGRPAPVPLLRSHIDTNIQKGSLSAGHIPCCVPSHSAMTVFIWTSFQALALSVRPWGLPYFCPRYALGATCASLRGWAHRRSSKQRCADKSHMIGASFIQFSIWIILCSLGHRFVTQQHAFVDFGDAITPR